MILGDLPIDIKWQLNGNDVDEAFITTAKLGKRLTILNIDSVNGYHAGNYTCRAANQAGVVEHMATLIVNGDWKTFISENYFVCVRFRCFLPYSIRVI